MKNFVKHTFAFAICAAALLSSCIKEQSYEVHELMLDANITRATTSSEQGDQINDVMIWAFDANDSYNKVGWVEYTAPANTYKDITVHVPVKICGDAGSIYRLVAVINKDKFKNTVTFDSNTTYQELIAASFDNSELLAENLIETNNPGNPAVMPISHWCDVPVTEADFGQHKHVEMKVFRSVAKTHFYITKKSEFDMDVTTLELHNGCLPTGGMVLSNSTSTALESESATPSWFSTNGKIPATVSATTLVDNLITSPVAVGEGMVDSTENRDGANLDLTKYQLVGSKLIYETNKTATVAEGYGSVTETSGYYYKIGYTVGDGTEYIRYFALPQIARNHDYQVRARVDAGGQMTLTILVNEWTEDEDQVIDYQNSVTVETSDMLDWTSYTSFSYTTDDVPVVDGNIDFEGLNNGAAQCTFRLRTPKGGRWYAELVTISGDPDHFIFEKAEVTHTVEGASQTTTINGSNSTVISGDISDGLITLYIKTAKGNSATQNSATEDAVVELQISAKKTWGGRDRTYKVYGLTGLENNANYTLTHLLGN
ncbi:MAG: hypothetical protein IIW45_00325 [Alistipes sp.]|nr:hypothetical protein [Alistipes sp.]